MKRSSCFGLALIAAACDAGIEPTAPAGSAPPAPAAIVATFVAPPSEQCPAGGSRVESGLDDGDGGGVAHNGALEPGEADSSVLVCNSVVRHESLVEVTTIGAGEECAAGGQRIDVGVDDGGSDAVAGDGVLGASEIDETTWMCNVASAPEEEIIFPSLVRLTEERIGRRCGAPGYRVDAGLDDGEASGVPGDGTLQDGEIDSTTYACPPPKITGQLAFSEWDWANDVERVLVYDADAGSISTVFTADSAQGVYLYEVISGAGAAAWRVFGPDGYELYVRDAQTGAVERLDERWTESDWIGDPALRYGLIAFVATVDGISNVYMGPYATGPFLPVTDNQRADVMFAHPDFDGDYVVAYRWDGADQIVLIDTRDGSVVELGAGGPPRIDEGLVVFQRSAQDQSDVWLYDIAAGASTNLTAGVEGWVGAPVVDGGRVAFYHTSGFRLFDATSGETSTLDIGSAAVAFRAGQLLWLSSSAAKVYGLDTATARTVHTSTGYLSFRGMP